MLDFLLSLDPKTLLVCSGFFVLCSFSAWVYEKLGEREPGEAKNWELHDG